MKNKTKFIFIVIIFFLGYLIGNFTTTNQPQKTTDLDRVSPNTTWTCSMHPQIKLPKKGKCPICFMDLIELKLNTSEQTQNNRELKMSQASLKLAQIRTTTVKRSEAYVQLELFGKVMIDTTQKQDIAILSNSEVRNLYVNYIGARVKKGEHIAELYSPQVYEAGKNYLIALNSKNRDIDLIKSLKNKIVLLGAPIKYIENITTKSFVPETFILKSPRSGYIQNLIGNRGKWIKKGQDICSVVNLKKLWIHLDVYENDISHIKYGQEVNIKNKNTKGENLKGKISYISPILNDTTRTLKVRVNINNEAELLKPNMFVSASLNAQVNSKGLTISPNLKDKWISPMHPEIIKDNPGKCDVCNMDLIKFSEYINTNPTNHQNPLLIPQSSVLITGKRAIVYLKKQNSPSTFEGKTIELGPRTKSHYVVLDGLKEGDIIVTHGAFKIDSALQILAKPSMMSLDNDIESEKHPPKKETSLFNKALSESLEDFISQYLSIHKYLSNDQYKELNPIIQNMISELEYIDYSELTKNQLTTFNDVIKRIEANLKLTSKSNNLKNFRRNFLKLSDTIIHFIQKTKYHKLNLYIVHCSMANASWIQNNKSINNPYYGRSMLKCGEIKSSIQSDHP